MTETKALPGVFATLRSTPTPARYLLGGVLINQMGAFVQTFLVLYLVHKGLSAGQAGISLAVFSAGAVLGMLIGGELIHRIGARNTLGLSMACSAVLITSIPWLSRPSSYLGLLLFVAIAGTMTQAYRPAAASLLSDLMPSEQRVMAFSMLRIAMNIGAAIGPLIAAGLILVNWDLLFWFDGITALIYAALVIRLIPRELDTAAGPAKRAETRSGYAILLRDSKYLIYLLNMLLSAMIYVQFMVVLPLKITAEGHPTALYSVALALSSTILITCELAITARVQNWPGHVAAGVGTTIVALGAVSYGISSGSAALILLSTVVSVSGIMTSGPTKFAYPAKFPAAVKGRYIAASQSVFGLGMALGPAVGVIGWNRLGNGFWWLCGAIGLIAAACAVVSMREAPALSR